MTNAWPRVEPTQGNWGHRLTVEEWLALGEDDEGELVDCRLVEEERPDFTHQLTLADSE